MNAVRFHAHGGPDVLKLEDAPDPEPRPGYAIVRVRACALNHLDIWQRRGIERVKIPFPHISGADVAGEIAGTGERVMLQPGLSCGMIFGGPKRGVMKFPPLGTVQWQSGGIWRSSAARGRWRRAL